MGKRSSPPAGPESCETTLAKSFMERQVRREQGYTSCQADSNRIPRPRGGTDREVLMMYILVGRPPLGRRPSAAAAVGGRGGPTPDCDFAGRSAWEPGPAVSPMRRWTRPTPRLAGSRPSRRVPPATTAPEPPPAVGPPGRGTQKLAADTLKNQETGPVERAPQPSKSRNQGRKGAVVGIETKVGCVVW